MMTRSGLGESLGNLISTLKVSINCASDVSSSLQSPSKQANKQPSKQANKQPVKQASKQATKQANKQPVKQANNLVDGFPLVSDEFSVRAVVDVQFQGEQAFLEQRC